MDVTTFAAERSERQVRSRRTYRPLVEAWLASFSPEGADELLSAMIDEWESIVLAAEPDAYIDAMRADFAREVAEALAKTTPPDPEGFDAKADLIATWAAVVATNDATWRGHIAGGGVRTRWVAHRDDRTRPTHRAADGQVRSTVGAFDVGGAKLRYPGDPRAPLEETMNCRCVLAPAGRIRRPRMKPITAAATGEDFDDRPWALVALLPADEDVNAASSEEIAHATFIWMGEPGEDFDQEAIASEVGRYAAGTTPITVPVRERGVLGDDSADVLFLEPTDSLLALRDGLLNESEALRVAHDAAEQYPEWTPHVTLGYPDAPATADYDGDQITFDRFALWVGNDRQEFPMGTSATPGLVASAAVDVEVEEPEAEVPEEIDITDEPLVDEIPDEVPVHGVATIEGRATGDGRGFAAGAIQFPPLPAPLGYEFETTHGGGSSRVAIVGRIDEMWKVEIEPGVFEVRYRGAVLPSKPYANEALDHIVDGTINGVSVKIDDVAIDVSQAREQFKQQITSERDARDSQPAPEDGSPKSAPPMSDQDIEALVDAFIGTGETEVTWVSRARARNFDMVHMPAFIEGYIALGPAFADELTEEDQAALAACGCYQPAEGDDTGVIRGEDQAELPLAASGATFAPGTKDGPGWVTHPRATARIRRYWVHGKGAAKIRWGAPGDFNRCRSQLAKYVANPDWLAGLCANMHKEALGFWPGEHHGAAAIAASAAEVQRAPLFEFATGLQPIIAGGSFAAEWPDFFPSDAFSNPRLNVATPITFTDDGRVFGHIAEWNACHIGYPGICQNPPASSSGYSRFLKGILDTDRGPIPIGTLTTGIGHASLETDPARATAHYDKPDAVFAYVNVGEDAIGIWFAGVVRPGLPESKIREVKALGAISGDWRPVGRELEMIACTAVNTPGFAIARQPLVAAAGGVQTVLIPPPVVAGGLLVVPSEPSPVDEEAITRRVLAALERQPRLERVHAAREEARTARIEEIRQFASRKD